MLAANRDEYHARPAAAADWWPDRPHILGGRDLQAGGTWLAVARDGRFAVVLNDARRPRPAQAPSRGELVPGFLDAGDPAAWLRDLAAARARYAGFHLLAGDRGGVHYVASATAAPQSLSPGIHVVDNSGWDSGTPRSRRARECLARPLAAGGAPEGLLDRLADRADPGEGAGDSRPVFLRDAEFGTRCSTALVLERGALGTGRLVERRFDERAAPIGCSGFSWSLADTEPC